MCETKYFHVETDPLKEGTFIITLSITIYRQMLGKYPSFLSEFGTPDKERDGFTTRFWYLMKDEKNEVYALLENKEEAEKIALRLERTYAKSIKECENSGIWEDCPINFDELTLIFHK